MQQLSDMLNKYFEDINTEVLCDDGNNENNKYVA